MHERPAHQASTSSTTGASAATRRHSGKCASSVRPTIARSSRRMRQSRRPRASRSILPSRNDRDAVGDARQFFHAMRDVHDATPWRLSNAAINANKPSISRSLNAAVGSSITMNAPGAEGFGDFDELLLATDRCGRTSSGRRDRVRRAPLARPRRPRVEKSTPGRLVPRHDVLGDVQVPVRG